MQAKIIGHEKDLITLDNLRNRAEQIDNEVILLENQIRKLKSERAEVSEKGKAFKAETEKFKAPDIAGIIAEIDAYQEFQKFSLKIEAIQKKEVDLEKSDAVRTNLDELYKALTNEIPRKLLAEIDLPIKDLEIDGDKILIKGVEIDKLSDSQKIKFAIDIAEVGGLEVAVFLDDGDRPRSSGRAGIAIPVDLFAEPTAGYNVQKTVTIDIKGNVGEIIIVAFAFVVDFVRLALVVGFVLE